MQYNTTKWRFPRSASTSMGTSHFATLSHDSLARHEAPKNLPYDRPTRILRIDQMHVIPRPPSLSFPPGLLRRRPILGDDPQPCEFVLVVIVLPAIRGRTGEPGSGGDEAMGRRGGEG